MTLKEKLKILEYTDIALYGEVQTNRKKSYVDCVKRLVNKYGVEYYNLIQKAVDAGIQSIYTIERYGDRILNGDMSWKK